ncbi:OLC1v1008051C1 [Oldenlandia corymbosa var. corymbosa]|uniref:OLC1v1008051C1 n=1 Tax=Oldenlandia corymbosa var. corymbosa TaxID=529605 RepID=A0AAV1DKS9_OLDCO|nr:OLC1v1008051C1 [Oldenlandia corymbosa var. corymbosa]
MQRPRTRKSLLFSNVVPPGTEDIQTAATSNLNPAATSNLNPTAPNQTSPILEPDASKSRKYQSATNASKSLSNQDRIRTTLARGTASHRDEENALDAAERSTDRSLNNSHINNSNLRNDADHSCPISSTPEVEHGNNKSPKTDDGGNSKGNHTPEKSKKRKSTATEIHAVGKTLSLQSICSRKIRSLFEDRLEVGAYSWPRVSPGMKDFYWNEFKDPGEENQIKEAWKLLAAERYRDLRRDLREWDEKPYFVQEDVSLSFTNHWQVEDFMMVGRRNSKNRRSPKGPVSHNGGSVSFIEHALLHLNVP